jgi:hypothetical protein
VAFEIEGRSVSLYGLVLSDGPTSLKSVLVGRVINRVDGPMVLIR